MKSSLTQLELKVVAASHLNAKASVEDISRICKVKAHQTRYALQSLLRKGAISEVSCLNLAPLGLQEVSILVRLSRRSKSFHAQWANAVAALPGVSWLMEVAGTYDFCVVTYIFGLDGLSKALTALAECFPESIAEKRLAFVQRWTMFGYRHFGPSQTPLVIDYTVPRDPPVLDALDIKLLDTLVYHPSASIAQRARACGAPQSSVTYRLERLKSLGVYRDTFYSFDCARASLEGVYLYITCKGLHARLKKGILKFCLAHPIIVSLEEVLSSHDFQMRLDVYKISEVTDLVSKLEEEFGECFSAIEILPSIRTHKHWQFNSKQLFASL